MITINIDKARLVAHNIRRAFRAIEFAPLDAKSTIPGEAVEVERIRGLIREKYAVLQQEIDSVGSVDELSSLIGRLTKGVFR